MENNTVKKPSLFTLEGGRGFLEFMRNMTPQILVGSISIICTIRALDTGNIPLWILTLIMWFVFFYIAVANYINFISPVMKYIGDELADIEGYMTKSDTVGLKFDDWLKGLIKNICLTYKHKKKIFLELVLLAILVEIPSVVALFAAGTTASQLYSFMFIK